MANPHSPACLKGRPAANSKLHCKLFHLFITTPSDGCRMQEIGLISMNLTAENSKRTKNKMKFGCFSKISCAKAKWLRSSKFISQNRLPYSGHLSASPLSCFTPVKIPLILSSLCLLWVLCAVKPCSRAPVADEISEDSRPRLKKPGQKFSSLLPAHNPTCGSDRNALQ